MLLFILSCIGLTNIIVHGSIFEELRNWLKPRIPNKLYQLIDCYQCCGFWMGMVCGVIIFGHTNLELIPIYGCAGSFVSSFTNTVVNYLDAKALFAVSNEK